MDPVFNPTRKYVKGRGARPTLTLGYNSVNTMKPHVRGRFKTMAMVDVSREARVILMNIAVTHEKFSNR